jgi:predicted P-loop ATPase
MHTLPAEIAAKAKYIAQNTRNESQVFGASTLPPLVERCGGRENLHFWQLYCDGAPIDWPSASQSNSDPPDDEQSGVVAAVPECAPDKPANDTRGVLAFVKMYQDAGFRPVQLYGIKDCACRCRKGKACGQSSGKHPIGDEWETREQPLTDFRETDNVGLQMGEQPSGGYLVAIDIDGDPTDEELAELCAANDWIPVMIAKTPHGYHVVVQWPDGVDRPGNWVKPDGSKCDIRAHHGQIVVEPSVNKDGAPYTWLGKCAPARLSVEAAQAILTAGRGSRSAITANGASVSIEECSPYADAVNQLAETFKLAFSLKGKRHVVKMALAGMLAGMGWPEQRAAQFVADVCVASGFESFGEAEVRDTYRLAAIGKPHTGASSLIRYLAENETFIAFNKSHEMDGLTAKERAELTIDGARKTLNINLSLQREGSKVTNSRSNIASIIALHPAWRDALAFDDFSQDIVKRVQVPALPFERDATDGQEWCDVDATRTANWFAKVYQLQVAPGSITDQVLATARSHKYHPVRDYLHRLKWDGTPRIDTLFSRGFGAQSTDYVKAVSRYFLIGAVARVMRPGCKLDTAPILEGAQGTFKSSGLKALMPHEEWFADTSAQMGNKDAFLAVQGIWLYELAELSAMSRADVGTIKNFMSSATDRFRVPYGRRMQRFPRQVALIGSTNETVGYLFDDTGNRRFYPIACGVVDVQWVAANRDQLWAEAFAMFAKGDHWWADTATIEKLCNEQQSARESVDPWDEKVGEYLHTLTQTGKSKNPWEGISTFDVLSSALFKSVADCTNGDAQRVSKLLVKHRWQKWPTSDGKRKRDGVMVRVWTPPAHCVVPAGVVVPDDVQVPACA